MLCIINNMNYNKNLLSVNKFKINFKFDFKEDDNNLFIHYIRDKFVISDCYRDWRYGDICNVELSYF